MFFVIGLTIILVALACQAAPQQRRQQKAQVVYSCTVPNTVALTFDDGPYIYLPDVVNALVAAGVKGTFFFILQVFDEGGCIYTPAMVSNVLYAYNHGMQVASHTWSHPYLTSLSQDQVVSQMSQIDLAIEQITGALPAFMRPPYGAFNDGVLQAAAARNQTVVVWDFEWVIVRTIYRKSEPLKIFALGPTSSGDSTGASPAQQMASYDALVARRPNTVLSLEHEVYETSAHEVIPYAIQKLKGAGYNLVTVAECLGMQPYQFVSAPMAQQAVSCTKFLISIPPSFTDFFNCMKPGNIPSTWHC
ncbi:carbohydrate esterase family 4 protein [Laccaria bicolor S238N-H82]|uniref:Carbohydrate esterase family 4 protein n=1 Tax=Laccaria bicolor (strain S238N-H82 / ATCC MYA-4686) TaxID=486041 RepID=B0DQI7_LACBS|nr:carbohydrate esterase family 4 protein [Laccaria bicolor S238N-H82]EDR03042.1 carbohydrate esterase family 4 protein [Laccaria bicolor S238N-H82]|eukprot:XP_001886183.1 carbohydrate esterase family 4 protein [Laccaria bicolor S238N-H82]